MALALVRSLPNMPCRGRVSAAGAERCELLRISSSACDSLPAMASSGSTSCAAASPVKRRGWLCDYDA